MRTFIEKVGNEKMGGRHTDPVVEVFEQWFEETNFKRHTEEGYTLTLWWQYHYMVYVINICISAER